MFKIELAADSVADKLSRELNLDNDRREVIAYGAFALFQTVLSIVLVFLFGWIFKVILEALIISFAVSILRKYSGGVHATTSDACTIIGTTVFVGLAKALSFSKPWLTLESTVGILIILFLWCYYIIFKLAPVESPAKKLSEKKKKRMKKGSIITLSVYVSLTVLFVVLYYAEQNKSLLLYSLCVCIGSVWQMFTLTRNGHLWLTKIDKSLNYILNKEGGN